MEEKVMQILDNVQSGTVNHQKNIKLLENVYNLVQYEDFLELFLGVIQGVLQQDYKNPCFRLVLEFLAKFVGYIARVQSPQNVSELDNDPPTHPFLTAVIKEVVRHHRLPIPECRYNACSFLSLTLQNIGDKTQMDSQICDVIQIAMLENIQDYKPVIRLQAVSALVRLQDPLNPECPVIRAYITCLKDSSALVRREAVRRIAPNALTIPKLKDRTTDTDPNVRSAAFTHVAEIGIKHFKIVHRQFILKSGFSEKNRLVRKVFLEYLLPKWLTALNGEYIGFLTAIKLDAEESDILNTEELSKGIMEVFFQTEPIDNLIKALPLDENKVIPLNNMRTEISHYWNILTKYLRKSEEMDEYLDTIIPELTSFCNYLEKIISTKFSKTMEDWEYLDFQYMLYHLFDIAENYDLSEEVGRRSLDNLLKKVLRNHRLQPRLLSKIIQIASKLASSMDFFTNEMCLIISDIREPLTEQEPSVHDKREKDFKMAELKVKVNILEGDLEDAIDEKDFQKAQVLKNEIEEYLRKMEALETQTSQTDKVRVSKDDPETVCWCLDLLAAVLIHSNLKTLSPSMVTCREEFLKPLIESKNVEIAWRVFKCLAAYCIFDKKMAEEHVKQLMVPIASYRVIPNFNKTVLIVSISIITDLIRLHGTKLFSTEDDNNTTSSTQTSTRRRLYNEEVEDFDTIRNTMSVEVIVNVVLNMLDDENREIRDAAILAAAKLILNEFTINPMVVTRLILKWYNPMTQKTLQQKLGMIIKEYTDKIKESKEIVAKSVIPILTNIAEAPRTSPLAEVDIENVTRFLAAITDNGSTNGIVDVHRDLAHTLIREIASRPAESVTPHLAKMLTVLNIAPDNSPPTKELIGHAELLLEREALDKGPKQYIIKFVDKLNGNLTMINSVNTIDTMNNESTEPSSANNTRNTATSRRLTSIIEDDDEAEISAAGNEESSKDVPTERRRINSKISTEETTDKNREISSEKSDSNNSNKNKDDKQSDAVKTVESVQKTSDPDIISPSISPDSQEQTINNLRKRTRSHNSVKIIAQSKKKKVESKGAKKTTKKQVESNYEKNKSMDKEVEKDVDASSAESAGNKNMKSNSNNAEEAKGKSNKETNSKGSNKDEKNDDKELISSPFSNSGSTGSENNRRSLQVVLSNIIPNTPLNEERTDQDKKSGSSDKENSFEIPENVETGSAENIFRGDKEQPKATNQHNSNIKFRRSVGQRNSLRFKTHAVADDISTSSDSVVSGINSKGRDRPRKKNKTSEQSGSKTNKVTSTERRSLERTREKWISMVANILRSSASESSLTTRSRSRSMSSTPIIGEGRNKKDKKTNTAVQSEKEIGRQNKPIAKTKNHLDRSLSTSSLNASSGSRSLRSQSSSEVNVVVEDLRPKEDEKKAKSYIKNSSARKQTGHKTTSANQIADKRSEIENSREPKKSLFLNNNITTSQSFTSDRDEGNKYSLRRKGRKKREKGLNNNGVGRKEIDIIANGVQKSVEKLINTPQVKRKKARGPKDKKIREELTIIITEESFNSSEQSLHTIIEPSDIHTSLIPDGSRENSPQKSLRRSRRLQVVSETTSDSESADSPIRKSSRKKKVYNRS